MLLLNEAHRRLQGLLVDGLHALLRQRPRVLDLLAALPSAHESIAPRGQTYSGTRVLRIVLVLGLLLGIEVDKVAEFVEAVHDRQVLVAVALVVLAELAGGIALASSTMAIVTSTFFQPSAARERQPWSCRCAPAPNRR